MMDSGRWVNGLLRGCTAAAAALAVAASPPPVAVAAPPSVGAHAPGQRTAGRPTVAVLRITAPTQALGEACTAALCTAIGRLGSVRTVERAKLRQAFTEEALRREGVVAGGPRAAQVPDADYVVIGEAVVTDAPIAGKAVRLGLRLVDCSASVGEVAASINVYGGTPDGDLNQAIRRAAEAAARELAAYFPTRAQVILQQGRTAYVTLTTFDGVRRGTRVAIYAQGFDAVHPGTGQRLHIRGRAIEGRVVEVTDEYAVVDLGSSPPVLSGGEQVEVR